MSLAKHGALAVRKNNTLMERKLRIPQIQGVQGRMPYAAAKQQPSTASLWHALVTSAGDRGIIGFPEG